MLTIKRANFQSILRIKGKVYEWQPSESALNKPSDKTVLRLEVLNSRLKGRLDLHGNPYKPSVFYFKNLAL